MALVGFAVPAWVLMRGLSLKRLDGFLEDHAHRQFQRRHPQEHWENLDHSLNLVHAQGGREAFILLARDGAGQLLHRSAHWPPGIDEQALLVIQPPGDPGLEAEGPPPPLDGPGDLEGKSGHPPGPGPLRMHLVTRRDDGDTWRVGVMRTPWQTLVLGARVEAFTAEMRQLQNAFLLALPLALVLIGLGAWLVSRRALRPVRELADAVEQTTVRALDRRVPIEGVDEEFRRLTTAYNDMLERLERSYNQAIRFSADAAHELKTPLAIPQGHLEAAVQGAELASEEQQTYSELLEEVQHLKSIVGKLLFLSTADAGRLTLHMTRLDFTELVEGMCEDAEIVAPHLAIRKALAPDVSVKGDEELLRQVVSNLSSNAIKYNCDDGWIEYRLTASESMAALTVSNPGTPIPTEDRERIFDRFYRVDKARSRKLQGAGLGLSLAREIARTHDGELALAEGSEDLVTFVLTLPLSDPPACPS
jgi:heavy metal sensor kinase